MSHNSFELFEIVLISPKASEKFQTILNQEGVVLEIKEDDQNQLNCTVLIEDHLWTVPGIFLLPTYKQDEQWSVDEEQPGSIIFNSLCEISFQEKADIETRIFVNTTDPSEAIRHLFDLKELIAPYGNVRAMDTEKYWKFEELYICRISQVMNENDYRKNFSQILGELCDD